MCPCRPLPVIKFSYMLSQVARAKPGNSETVRVCRQSLADACWSWAEAFLAERPWDASLELLYLCVYAFDVVVCQERPSVLEVNEAIRGI